MAQLYLTLNQEEITRLFQEDVSGAFKLLLQQVLNAILKAESTEQLHAESYERVKDRTDYRNGTRLRSLTTRIGTIILQVPRHRDVPFKTLIFENYRRDEAALITVMAEMVVEGVSTAKVGRVMEELCDKSFSKQTVSEACKELDEAVKEFRERRLDGEYLYLMADATYLKVREDHRIRSKALMIAIGLTPEGKKEILSFSLSDAETEESWYAFFSDLKKRGLKGVNMATSDAHKGLTAALQRVFPDVPWQRCQAHFTRDITKLCPKHLQKGLRQELAEMFNADTLVAARKRKDEIIADYGASAPKAMECLDAGFDDAMTVMELPVCMRTPTRTSNCLERLNREVKRRSKVIGIFPNGSSAVRLMGSVLIEENKRWSTMRKTFWKPSVEELAKALPKLIAIAHMQQQMRLVA